MDAIAEELKPDGSVYEAMARDTYAIGYYLAHFKYRFLRLAYLFFLGGFVCAVAALCYSELASMVPVSGSTSTMAAWAPAAKVPRIGS